MGKGAWKYLLFFTERSELLYVETQSIANIGTLLHFLNYIGAQMFAHMWEMKSFLPEKTEMDLDKSSGGAK